MLMHLLTVNTTDIHFYETTEKFCKDTMPCDLTYWNADAQISQNSRTISKENICRQEFEKENK